MFMNSLPKDACLVQFLFTSVGKENYSIQVGLDRDFTQS